MFSILQDNTNTLVFPVVSTATEGDSVNLALSINQGTGADCEVHTEIVVAKVNCCYAIFDIEHSCSDREKFSNDQGEYLFKLSEGATKISQQWVKLYRTNEQ